MIRPVATTALAATAVAALVVSFVLGAAGLDGGLPWTELPFAAIGVATVVLGLLIVWRVRSNVVGQFVVVIGVAEAGLSVRTLVYELSAVGVLAEIPTVVIALMQNAAVVMFFAVGLLVMVFPGGALPGPRWRWLVAALAVGGLGFEVVGIVSTWPYAPPFDTRRTLIPEPYPLELAVTVIAAAVFFSALIVSVVLGLGRVRRAHGTLRAQLLWVLLGACTFLLFPIVCGIEVLLTGSAQTPSLVVAYAGLLTLPVGVTIAMLRHDLYDIDRVLASTVGYVIVLAALAGVFGTVLIGVGAVVGGSSPVAAATATAVAALLLVPLHRRVKRFVDDRLYPLRRAALVAIEGLQTDVNAGTRDPETLATTLAAAVRDPNLRIGYLRPGTRGFVDAEGRRVLEAGTTPIEVAGEQIGVLSAPTLSAALRRELASAGAVLVAIVGLRLGLSASLHEVERSRERILEAEDSARRRLERDLHDGAQQRLVALGMSLRLAQRHLDEDSVDIDGILDATVAELSTAIAELRQIAHGIRPGALDEGLDAALMGLARAVPIAVDLEVHAGDVSPPVATAAYYVVAESMANVVKHANADNIAVRVSRHPGLLRVSVRDDGRGGADAERGTGIVGLRDRVTAIGGSLTLTSPPGRGTLVEAELPCAS